MTKDEALKMAIEFIDEITNAAGKYPYVDKTSLVADSYAMASKLKEALEQPAQEPVAWCDSLVAPKAFATNFQQRCIIPLYTHPAPSWQGLSDNEKLAIIRKWKDAHTMREQELIGLGDAFEQASRNKNGKV